MQIRRQLKPKKCKTNNLLIMKKNKLKKLASVTLAVIVLSSCGGITKMKDAASDVKSSVTPSPLEMHGGKVDVTINTTFPGKYFNKKAIMVITPVLTYDGGETAFDSVVFQGEAVEDNHTPIPYENGKAVTYSSSVDYTEGMSTSNLVLRAYAQVKDTKVPLPDMKIADGVVSTPALVQIDPKAIMVGDNFERIQPDAYEADIHYLINRSEVPSKELKAEDIKSLETKIMEASKNERVEFKDAKVSAYASPDGPLDLNDKLSAQRGKTAQNYFSRVLKKTKVDKVASKDFLSVVSTPEDWEGFKTLMQKSDIKDKDLVLRVLSMHSDPVVREREIKNISEAFEEIKEKILPELRRSKLIVSVEKIGYSDSELDSIMAVNPDILNEEEILRAASLIEDNESKLAAYQKAAENFPNSFRAINNVGFVQLQMGNVDAAQTSFEKAKELEDNNVINNNLGVIAMKQGDKQKAEELFTAAMGAGDVVSQNLGIIKIIDGDYQAAVNYYGNTCSFNSALAKMLNGSSNEALSSINCLDDPDAMDYYLKAIIGARMENAEVVFTNLRSAVGKDASLKAKAKKDLEFVKFRADETFSSIIQ
jgi:tetratricopeptide (TPR) repeat protein